MEMTLALTTGPPNLRPSDRGTARKGGKAGGIPVSRRPRLVNHDVRLAAPVASSNTDRSRPMSDSSIFAQFLG